MEMERRVNGVKEVVGHRDALHLNKRSLEFLLLEGADLQPEAGQRPRHPQLQGGQDTRQKYKVCWSGEGGGRGHFSRFEAGILLSVTSMVVRAEIITNPIWRNGHDHQRPQRQTVEARLRVRLHFNDIFKRN